MYAIRSYYALRVDRQIVHAGGREHGRPFGMTMNGRVDLGPRLVHARVQMEFQRRLAVAVDDVAVEIDGADIVSRQPAALTGADIRNNFV